MKRGKALKVDEFQYVGSTVQNCRSDEEESSGRVKGVKKKEEDVKKLPHIFLS